MKKILWTYSLTISASAIAVLIVVGTILSIKSALWFVIIGAVFLILMGIVADFAINKYIRELSEMDKYKTLWNSLKSESGTIINSQRNTTKASSIKSYMEDMEKKIEKIK